MPSYGVQLQAAKTAHTTVKALEAAASAQIAQAFDDWESGKLDAQTVRHRLEAIVRAGYRASAAIAVANTQKMAELPGWKPQSNVNADAYLKSLIDDIRSNLRIYKASPKTDVDRRRAVFRMQLSAEVGTERGYTDGLVKSNQELEDFGYAIKKIWMANFVDNTPCPLCLALHGTELPLDSDFDPNKISAVKVYHNLAGPPRHPHCFVAGTKVTGPTVSSVSERLYKGKLVELEFGEGKFLTGTPNHPILTTKGWASLGDLVEGDELVYDIRTETATSGPPLTGNSNDDQRPILIEDVAKAFSSSLGVTATKVPSSAPDFHGDGTEGEINVVYSNSLLRSDLNTSLFQPMDDRQFSSSNVEFVRDLVSNRPIPFFFITSDDASDSIMGSNSSEPVLFKSFSGSSEQVGISNRSGLNSSFEEALGDWASIYSKTLRDTQDALSFQMAANDLRHLGIQIVKSTRHWEGYSQVYNLETSDGWYTANGIIAHNCQCYVVTLITTLENVFEKLDIDKPTPAPPTMMSTDVKSMPGAVFTAVVKVLQKIMSFMKGTS